MFSVFQKAKSLGRYVYRTLIHASASSTIKGIMGIEPDVTKELSRTREALAQVTTELSALKSILAEFEDAPSIKTANHDPLVSPQSLRTKIIEGFVEGWGPAAPGVSPGLKARYPDIDDEQFWKIAHKALPHTALSVPRLYAIYQAVTYLCAAKIPGDIVECGVFKGGSALMIAESLVVCGDTTRQLYLFDTFTGWPEPTDADTDFLGQEHRRLYDEEQARRDNGSSETAPSVYHLDNFFEQARRAILDNTDYPESQIHFVPGLVEVTLPHPEIRELALLRLDTDYYESTRHEIQVLWPKLNVGGVLLVDDYGQFHGARRAIDEHFASDVAPVLLHRDDVTGRSAVKIHP